tara:strand:- start:241 stop:432 length:192 start_codon:yes stop_codon:yes gene_type:complete
MAKSKWHTISIKQKSFKELQSIQKAIPIRASLSQTIDWLISVGQKQIKSELQNDNTTRIPRQK